MTLHFKIQNQEHVIAVVKVYILIPFNLPHWISNSPTMTVPTHPNPKANNVLGSRPFSYVNPLPTDQMITSQDIIFNCANLPPSPPCARTGSLTPPPPHLPTSPQPILINFSFSPTLLWGFSCSSTLLTPSPL